MNQELINACLVRLDELSVKPQLSHVDLAYEQHVYIFTLQAIYDRGFEDSDLARQIIFELSYWPGAETYQEAHNYQKENDYAITR